MDRSTVSRGLRNDPRLPANTRERIQVAADALGYRPNPLLSELASSRWESGKLTDGVGVAYIDCTSLEHPTGIHVSLPLPSEAARLGYRLETFRRREFTNSAKLQTVLRNRGITDVILGPAHEESLSVQLDWSKFITIQLEPGILPLPLHSVVRDHFSNVVVAWQKAASQGYRRIGAVLLDHEVRLMDDIMRASAVHTCQTSLFPHLPILPLLRYRKSDAQHWSEFIEWVRTNKPEVIVGFSDAHHHVFHSTFGYDTPYICLHKEEHQGLAGILEDVESGAREAINLLHYCRRTYQWGIPEKRIDHVIQPTWCEGISLPKKGG